MYRPIPLGFFLLVVAMAGAGSASASTIGYWRMETDLDPDANGLEVANEVAFGTSLISSEAFVDAVAGPNGTVPLTGAPNLGSIGATIQGGSNGINATAAWYTELDVSSITIEFWARTVENTATLLSRTSGGSDGIVIANPNSLDVSYWVEDGAGGAAQVQLNDVFNMDANWNHFLFSYDELSGMGRFSVDGVQVAAFNGPDGRALVWGANVDLQIGDRMDYADDFNGTMDEVRIMDSVPGGADPSLLPEPSAGLGALAALGVLAWVRRRRPAA